MAGRAGRGRADAAHLFLAVVVQSVGPGGRRGAPRSVCDAPLCRYRSRPRASAGRDDSVPLPSPAGGADMGERLLDEVQRHLEAKGLKLAIGTIVDATIINAPSSCRKQNIGEEGAGHHTAIEKT